MLGGVVVGLGALLLIRWTPTRVRTAAAQAGVVFILVILLATAGRPGYLIYPLNLLLWSGLLGVDKQPPADRPADHGHRRYREYLARYRARTRSRRRMAKRSSSSTGSRSRPRWQVRLPG